MPTSLGPSRSATLTRPETLKRRRPCLTLHTPVIYQPRITSSLKSYIKCYFKVSVPICQMAFIKRVEAVHTKKSLQRNQVLEGWYSKEDMKTELKWSQPSGSTICL